MSKRQQTFRVVSVNDEAIDTESMTSAQMVAYFETRDEKLITPHIKPGSKPRWFHVREIPRRLTAGYVAAVSVDSVRCERAFHAGVTAIDDGDAPITLTRKNDVLQDETLDELGISWGELEEVGLIAWDHSFLVRKTVRSYRLPPTSLEALSRRPFKGSPNAASSPSSPATSSDSASSAASSEGAVEASSSAQDGDDCAKPTDATATETHSVTAD